MRPYQSIESGDDVTHFTNWLGSQPFITIDTETTGLEIFAPDFGVRLIQIGSPTEAWLAELPRWPGLFEWVFSKFPGRLVLHNSAYDMPALARHGISVPWSKVDDTMIALRIFQPTESAGLKPASRRLLGGDGGGEEVLKRAMQKQKWAWHEIPIDFEPYRFYAALDAVLTARIYSLPAIQSIVRSSQYALEMQVRAICSRMEANGMRIDPEFVGEKYAELRYEADDLIARFAGMVSLTSPEDLGRWFLDNTDRRYLTKRTRTGRIAVDKDVLEAIASNPGDHDASMIASAALRVRKVTKLASAYFENFTHYNYSGVIHPSIDTFAARTSRMSIRNPALQTLPKPNSDPESSIVRRAIVPLREGDVLLSADMQQIELRMAASLSGDDALIDVFAKPDDFFVETAREIFRDPSISKHDDRRQITKTFWYSVLYGAGVDTMARRAGISTERMAEVRSMVKARYPGLFSLQKRLELEARTTGGVRTFGGVFLPVDPAVLYAATNFKIQGSAAEVLKRSLVALGQAGFEDHLLVPVHDEVVFSLPESDVDEARHTIVASMEDRENFAVPLTAGINGPGMTWADL